MITREQLKSLKRGDRINLDGHVRVLDQPYLEGDRWLVCGEWPICTYPGVGYVMRYGTLLVPAATGGKELEMYRSIRRWLNRRRLKLSALYWLEQGEPDLAVWAWRAGA